MAHQGYDFIYNGVSSSQYGLKICSFDSAGYRYVGGSGVELITDKSARSLKTTMIDIVPGEVLEFDLEVYAETPPSMLEADSIKAWLFGAVGGYKKLYILNDDLNCAYYNCILQNAEDIQINGNNGWKFTVTCDSGGAWENPKTVRYQPASGATIVFNNLSSYTDYTYPTIKFKMGSSSATSFKIKNTSDNNREFSFTGILNNEIITVDCEKGIITSDQNLDRLSKCNKNFLRLKRGINNLVCTGKIAYLDITTQNFRRFGG